MPTLSNHRAPYTELYIDYMLILAVHWTFPNLPKINATIYMHGHFRACTLHRPYIHILLSAVWIQFKFDQTNTQLKRLTLHRKAHARYQMQMFESKAMHQKQRHVDRFEIGLTTGRKLQYTAIKSSSIQWTQH